MAFSKAHIFNPHDYLFSLICHALSHPARILILRKLIKEGKCSVKQLKREVPLSGPTLSQHLRILLTMDIIHCEEQCPTVFYFFNHDLFETATIIKSRLLPIIEDISSNINPEVMKLELYKNMEPKGLVRSEA